MINQSKVFLSDHKEFEDGKEKKKKEFEDGCGVVVSSRRTLVELQRAIDVLLYLLLISFSFFFSLTLTYYSVCDTVKTRVELQMIKNH